MAITTKIAATTSAVEVTDATTELVATGPFVVYADNFAVGESVAVYRLGPSATFLPLTNKDGSVFLSAIPNMIYVEAAGTYRFVKTITATAASVGIEQI